MSSRALAVFWAASRAASFCSGGAAIAAASRLIASWRSKSGLSRSVKAALPSGVWGGCSRGCADGLDCFVFQVLLTLDKAAGEGLGVVADVVDVACQAIKRGLGLSGAVAGLVKIATVDRVAGAGQSVDIDPAATVLRQRLVEADGQAAGVVFQGTLLFGQRLDRRSCGACHRRFAGQLHAAVRPGHGHGRPARRPREPAPPGPRHAARESF